MCDMMTTMLPCAEGHALCGAGPVKRRCVCASAQGGVCLTSTGRQCGSCTPQHPQEQPAPPGQGLGPPRLLQVHSAQAMCVIKGILPTYVIDCCTSQPTFMCEPGHSTGDEADALPQVYTCAMRLLFHSACLPFATFGLADAFCFHVGHHTGGVAAASCRTSWEL